MAASLRNEEPKRHVRRRNGCRQAKPLTLPSFMNFDAIALVGARIEESDGKAGTREQNFDLIHYRDIIHHNWELFEKLFAYGTTGNKDKRTGWINEISLMRNSVMHPSRREFLSPDKLSKLEQYEEWLKKSVAGEVQE
jgi:hypothetical protein